jgi:hypothetical protein
MNHLIPKSAGGPGSGKTRDSTETIDRLEKSPLITIHRRKKIKNHRAPDRTTNVKLSNIKYGAQETYDVEKLGWMLTHFDEWSRDPIDVARVDGEYHLMDGHHRFLAADRLDETSLPANVWVMGENEVRQVTGQKTAADGEFDHAGAMIAGGTTGASILANEYLLSNRLPGGVAAGIGGGLGGLLGMHYSDQSDFTLPGTKHASNSQLKPKTADEEDRQNALIGAGVGSGLGAGTYAAGEYGDDAIRQGKIVSPQGYRNLVNFTGLDPKRRGGREFVREYMRRGGRVMSEDFLDVPGLGGVEGADMLEGIRDGLPDSIRENVLGRYSEMFQGGDVPEGDIRRRHYRSFAEGPAQALSQIYGDLSATGTVEDAYGTFQRDIGQARNKALRATVEGEGGFDHGKFMDNLSRQFADQFGIAEGEARDFASTVEDRMYRSDGESYQRYFQEALENENWERANLEQTRGIDQLYGGEPGTGGDAFGAMQQNLVDKAQSAGYRGVESAEDLKNMPFEDQMRLIQESGTTEDVFQQYGELKAYENFKAKPRTYDVTARKPLEGVMNSIEESAQSFGKNVAPKLKGTGKGMMAAAPLAAAGYYGSQKMTESDGEPEGTEFGGENKKPDASEDMEMPEKSAEMAPRVEALRSTDNPSLEEGERVYSNTNEKELRVVSKNENTFTVTNGDNQWKEPMGIVAIKLKQGHWEKMPPEEEEQEKTARVPAAAIGLGLGGAAAGAGTNYLKQREAIRAGEQDRLNRYRIGRAGMLAGAAGTAAPFAVRAGRRGMRSLEEVAQNAGRTREEVEKTHRRLRQMSDEMEGLGPKVEETLDQTRRTSESLEEATDQARKNRFFGMFSKESSSSAGSPENSQLGLSKRGAPASKIGDAFARFARQADKPSPGKFQEFLEGVSGVPGPAVRKRPVRSDEGGRVLFGGEGDTAMWEVQSGGESVLVPRVTKDGKQIDYPEGLSRVADDRRARAVSEVRPIRQEEIRSEGPIETEVSAPREEPEEPGGASALVPGVLLGGAGYGAYRMSGGSGDNSEGKNTGESGTITMKEADDSFSFTDVDLGMDPGLAGQKLDFDMDIPNPEMPDEASVEEPSAGGVGTGGSLSPNQADADLNESETPKPEIKRPEQQVA